jgi:hypothetical protein
LSRRSTTALGALPLLLLIPVLRLMLLLLRLPPLPV